jgi:hypothetical protein
MAWILRRLLPLREANIFHQGNRRDVCEQLGNFPDIYRSKVQRYERNSLKRLSLDRRSPSRHLAHNDPTGKLFHQDSFHCAWQPALLEASGALIQ